MEKRHLKKRHRMRKKDIVKFSSMVETVLGISLDTVELDCAELDHMTVYIVKGEIIAMELENDIFLTLRGILRYNPKKRYVVVDEGAVRFLYNGADVMTPGIVDADPDIEKGELVWVKEIDHGRPLVVGKALMSGTEMVESEKGKGVETLHHLNDDIWNFEF